MVKKLNTFGTTVKTFLEKGYSQSWIARKLKVKRQRVNYWANHPLKSVQFRRKNYLINIISELLILLKIKQQVLWGHPKYPLLLMKN